MTMKTTFSHRALALLTAGIMLMSALPTAVAAEQAAPDIAAAEAATDTVPEVDVVESEADTTPVAPVTEEEAPADSMAASPVPASTAEAAAPAAEAATPAPPAETEAEEPTESETYAAPAGVSRTVIVIPMYPEAEIGYTYPEGWSIWGTTIPGYLGTPGAGAILSDLPANPKSVEVVATADQSSTLTEECTQQGYADEIVTASYQDGVIKLNPGNSYDFFHNDFSTSKAFFQGIFVKVTYETQVTGITVSKVVDGPAPADASFAFDVKLTKDDGTPLTGSYDYTTTGTGVPSGTLTLDANGIGTVSDIKAGQSFTVNGLPGGTKYTVTETTSTIGGVERDVTQDWNTTNITELPGAGNGTDYTIGLTKKPAAPAAGSDEVWDRPLSDYLPLGAAAGTTAIINDMPALPENTTVKLLDGDGNVVGGADIYATLTRNPDGTMTATAGTGWPPVNSLFFEIFDTMKFVITTPDPVTVPVSAISAGGAAAFQTITFTNTYRPGSFTVRKEVDSVHLTDSTFAYIVKLTDADDAPLPGSYNYTTNTGATGTVADGGTVSGIKAGESFTVTGLPYGAQYTVTEDTYTINGQTLPVTHNWSTDIRTEKAGAHFYLDYYIGVNGLPNITATKDVERWKKLLIDYLPYGTPAGTTVTINDMAAVPENTTVKLIDRDGNEVTDADSIATITRNPDGSLTITAGEKWPMTSNSAFAATLNGMSMLVTTTPDAAVEAVAGISAGGVASFQTVIFTNRTGSFSVRKAVDAPVGVTAPDASFAFDVTLTEADGTPLTGSYDYTTTGTGAPSGTLTLDGNGVGTISGIKDGQSFTVNGLPRTTKYTVSETTSAIGGAANPVTQDWTTTTLTELPGAGNDTDYTIGLTKKPDAPLGGSSVVLEKLLSDYLPIGAPAGTTAIINDIPALPEHITAQLYLTGQPDDEFDAATFTRNPDGTLTITAGEKWSVTSDLVLGELFDTMDFVITTTPDPAAVPVDGTSVGGEALFQTITFTNTYVPRYPLTFTKVDENGTAFTTAGAAAFALYRYDAAAPEAWRSETALATAASDAAGLVDLGRMPAGSYLLRENTAPAGYQLPDAGWLITLAGDGTVTMTAQANAPAAAKSATGGYTVANEPVPPTPTPTPTSTGGVIPTPNASAVPTPTPTPEATDTEGNLPTPNAQPTATPPAGGAPGNSAASGGSAASVTDSAPAASPAAAKAVTLPQTSDDRPFLLYIVLCGISSVAMILFAILLGREKKKAKAKGTPSKEKNDAPDKPKNNPQETSQDKAKEKSQDKPQDKSQAKSDEKPKNNPNNTAPEKPQ